MTSYRSRPGNRKCRVLSPPARESHFRRGAIENLPRELPNAGGRDRRPTSRAAGVCLTRWATRRGDACRCTAAKCWDRIGLGRSECSTLGDRSKRPSIIQGVASFRPLFYLRPLPSRSRISSRKPSSDSHLDRLRAEWLTAVIMARTNALREIAAPVSRRMAVETSSKKAL